MGNLVDIAQVISMFAALAAVWYAEQTVIETRALRREERVAHLLDLVTEVGESGTRAARGQAGENLLDVARHRLRAEREAEAVAVLADALEEVAALLVRLRAQGSVAVDWRP